MNVTFLNLFNMVCVPHNSTKLIRQVQIVNHKSVSEQKVAALVYNETHLQEISYYNTGKYLWFLQWVTKWIFIKHNFFIYATNTQAAQKGKPNYKINAVRWK